MKAPTIMAAVFLALAGGPAWSQSGDPLPDVELHELRGGIATPLGFDIGFAASIRTFVDGTLALETRLVWAPDGLQTQSLPGTPQPGVILGGGSAPVVGPAAGGATRILHDLMENRVASVVINTASNRTIRQETDITLRLPQLPQMQQQMAFDRMASTLQSAVGAALSDSASR